MILVINYYQNYFILEYFGECMSNILGGSKINSEMSPMFLEGFGGIPGLYSVAMPEHRDNIEEKKVIRPNE